MENSITVRKNSIPVVQGRNQRYETEPPRYYPACDREGEGKLLAELAMAAKDDRINTKNALSADIASTAKIQNYKGRVIAACERELKRPNRSEERRAELIAIMQEASESATRAGEESREFQRRQLEHSHKLLRRTLLTVVGIIGSTALIRAMAR